ncbi:MAG: serine acetyltransferase [Planctomycetes bacterium]|nr:serine acetyltransferase [Planctomycetota bacterium]
MVTLDNLAKDLSQGFHSIDWATAGSKSCGTRPSRHELGAIVRKIEAILYPAYFGPHNFIGGDEIPFIRQTLTEVVPALSEQIARALCFRSDVATSTEQFGAQVESLLESFLGSLTKIQHKVAEDVTAAFLGDPAAKYPDEALICYPGIQATIFYRIAHEFYRLGVPLLPRIITEYAHSITGIDIHPGAQIGDRFFIDHGTGVVIGETSIIGDDVRIYQGVTLGSKSFKANEDRSLVKGIMRHPIIGDRVIIYAGATILGRITIGSDSVIGGNVWVTESVPPKSKILQGVPRIEGFESGAGI